MLTGRMSCAVMSAGSKTKASPCRTVREFFNLIHRFLAAFNGDDVDKNSLEFNVIFANFQEFMKQRNIAKHAF